MSNQDTNKKEKLKDRIRKKYRLKKIWIILIPTFIIISKKKKQKN